MIGRSLLILVAAAGVAVMLMPRGGDAPQVAADTNASAANDPAATQAPTTGAASAGSAAPMSGGVGVTLQRGADSHFRADVRLNGQAATMLVDSGATVVVLTRSDAARAGIHPSDSAYTGTAQTAGGTVRVAPVTVDMLAIGSIERRNVAAVVVEGDALPQSLLGQSFLSQLSEVRIAGSEMRLR